MKSIVGVWVDLKGFEGIYKISTTGLIKTRKNELRKTYISAYGYPCITLIKDGKPYGKSMHRLMAIHFVKNDEPDTKKEVRHKNKIKTDYQVDNLVWVTRSDNMKHLKKTKIK